MRILKLKISMCLSVNLAGGHVGIVNQGDLILALIDGPHREHDRASCLARGDRKILLSRSPMQNIGRLAGLAPHGGKASCGRLHKDGCYVTAGEIGNHNTHLRCD